MLMSVVVVLVTLVLESEIEDDGRGCWCTGRGCVKRV